MKTKFLSLLSILFLIVILSGCDPDSDPNETFITDDSDFKEFTVSHDGTNVIIDVVFYGDYESAVFSIYFDNIGSESQVYQVQCYSTEFWIFIRPGERKDTMRRIPIITGNRYHLEFPLAVIEFRTDIEFSSNVWLLEHEQKDRMPETGYKTLTNIR